MRASSLDLAVNMSGEMTGRYIHAIELSPAYVDVAVMRWQTFANGQATLEGDGRTFDEIKQQRQAPTGDKAKKKAA